MKRQFRNYGLMALALILAAIAGHRILATWSAPPDFGDPTVWDGLEYTNYAAANPVGDVGPNHYVQAVSKVWSGGYESDSLVAVYNKHDMSEEPVTFMMGEKASEWSPCLHGVNSTMTDPVVIYDSFADRWLLTQGSYVPQPSTLCVYISKTGDPTGDYWVYAFSNGALTMNGEWPKIGVWPTDADDDGDGEYGSYLVTTYSGAYVLNRAKLLNGITTGTLIMAVPGVYGQPADADGASPPPMNAPGVFMAPDQNDPFLDLDLWQVDVSWSTPSVGTPEHDSISVEEFDLSLSGVPQTGGPPLDPGIGYLNHRLQYRNLGDGDERLLGNFTVDIDGGNHAGIRWFELHKDESEWAVRQEGDVTDDDRHRWLASIAMDWLGNIALGYSALSGEGLPGLEYTGRLAGATLGAMPEGDHVIQPGGDSLGHDNFGFYSSMNVDPSDDCTFWFTGEYIQSGHDDEWSTAIAAIRFPGCFNLTYPLTGPAGSGGLGTGKNTLALPYRPETGVDDALDLMKSIGGGSIAPVASISRFNTSNETWQVYTGRMGSPVTTPWALVPGEGYMVSMSENKDYVIVGSHDPGLAVQLKGPGASSQTGINFLSVPYHTTAANALQLMQDIGGGGITPVEYVAKFIRETDTWAVYTGRMGSPTQTPFAITAGEAYLVRVNTDIAYVPSHY